MNDALFDGDVAQLATGDRDAWTRVYRWLQPMLDGFFARQGMRNPEDLTSETFLRLSRSIDRFSEGGAHEFRAWAFAVARNVRIDTLRRAGARVDEVTDATVTGSDEESLTARHADPTRAYEDEIASDDAVGRLFAELTPQQRDVMALRIYGDLTVEQVAAQLDMSVGQAKQLQRRALRRLQELIEAAQRGSAERAVPVMAGGPDVRRGTASHGRIPRE